MPRFNAEIARSGTEGFRASAMLMFLYRSSWVAYLARIWCGIHCDNSWSTHNKARAGHARFARFSLGSDPAVLLHTPTRFIVHTQIKSALNCKSVPTTPTSTSVLR